jgi:DNA-binding LytR/AlgR family response regulator
MNKLRVAICDDEPEQSEYLSRLVSAWAGERGQSAALSAFTSAEELLFQIGGDEPGFDILLLDIQMRGMNGMALARQLRAKGSKSQIVFITGFADWLAEGYEVDALRYLMKPVNRGKLFEVLDKAAERAAKPERYVLLNIAGGTLRIAAGEIIYAESFSHYVEIHTRDSVLRHKIGISELETLLGEGFFRCHRSYIAGMKYVTAVSRAALRLENGAELPLSRKLYNAANEVFIAYNGGTGCYLPN